MDDPEGHHAACERMADDINNTVGPDSSLASAGPTSMSADVVADMLTTKCPPPPAAGAVPPPTLAGHGALAVPAGGPL